MIALEKKKAHISQWKELMTKELAAEFDKKSDYYFVSYLGLKAEQMNELRRRLKQHSSECTVVKNSVAKIALEKAGLSALIKFVEGGIVVITGKDAVTAAKTVVNFSKSHEALKIRGGYLAGDIVDETRIKFIATLPAKEALIGALACGLKSPLHGLVGVLSNTLRSFIGVIQAIKDKPQFTNQT